MKGVRLDAYLNYTCLFKTRSQASKAISLGRVTVNAQRTKPHHMVQVGEKITIERGERTRIIEVVALVEHNIPKKNAGEYYEDKTPPETEKEKEMKELDRLLSVKYEGKGRPTKRDRRKMRSLK